MNPTHTRICILCGTTEDLQKPAYVMCKSCEDWRIAGSGTFPAIAKAEGK